jgi:leader peptidase (prepilin peptidase)/N-methyltransferase
MRGRRQPGRGEDQKGKFGSPLLTRGSSVMIEARPVLADLPDWFTLPLAAVLGLMWGSFLNVVIYRVPREMSVVSPPSSCASCGARIAPYDNVPVLSWLVLRGRARCCGARISARYPVVELLGGAIGLATLELLLHTLPAETSLVRVGALFVAYFGLALGLVAGAFIDAEHMYLPDSITLGGTVVGLATASLRSEPFFDALIGAAIGFVAVWAPLIVAYARIRGRQGMGLGDAKLTMLAGAWFGWKGAVFVLFAGAMQGTLSALVIYLFAGKIDEPDAVRADREELQRAAAEGDVEAAQILAEDPVLEAPPASGLGQARIPFGPFLALACLELLFAHGWIEDAYRRWFLGGL